MSKKYFGFILFGIYIFLQACNTVPTATLTITPHAKLSLTSTPVPINTGLPSSTVTSTVVATRSSTITSSPPLSVTNTDLPNPTVPTNPITSTTIIIDHDSVELFDMLPPEYIQFASDFVWLHRHASVGSNIRFGLDCLANYFPERADPNQRPFACDKNINPEEIYFDESYASKNWFFEPHALPNPNPGWYNKTNFFIDRIDNLEAGENFKFASYNLGYVEDASIVDHFFDKSNADDALPSVADLEDLETRHPEITTIWWTIALARKTDPHILEFNEKMRAYALENNKIFMDIADIESHRPDGTPCKGVDQTGNPTEFTAICSDYTDEKFAGHLNAQGRARMSKAIWVMMAFLAGWDGISP